MRPYPISFCGSNKVLAAAAKRQGPSCVVIQIKALKMAYDLDVTKHHSMLRLIAEALESTDRAHTKQALEVVESMGLAAIAASLFEAHYTEFAMAPGVKKKNKASRYAAASLEASALLISAIQRASKPKDLELIDAPSGDGYFVAFSPDSSKVVSWGEMI